MNNELKKYVEENILPQYTEMLAGHSEEHVRNVIRRSLELAKVFGVDVNKCYVIAAYHDIGLLQGDRDSHHINSAKILREDVELRKYFSPTEINLMAEAVEDHRASCEYYPRSMYGVIVSDADRDDNIRIMITRSYKYHCKHDPKLSKEERLEKVFKHLVEKYSNNYYKLKESYGIGDGEAKRAQAILKDRELFDREVAKLNLSKLWGI